MRLHMPHFHMPHVSRDKKEAVSLIAVTIAVMVVLVLALAITVLAPVGTLPPPGVPVLPGF